MKPVLFLAALALSASAFAEVEWFTVVGDRERASMDTVEVNASPLSVSGDQRVMQLRVNRQTLREGWSGAPYRSYTAVVKFDCLHNAAQFQQIVYFAQPLWAGEPLKIVNYTEADRRFMIFRDMNPNPVERIMKAACYKRS
jgi:hypothetical protein